MVAIVAAILVSSLLHELIHPSVSALPPTFPMRNLMALVQAISNNPEADLKVVVVSAVPPSRH